jgi:hypothetical protein
MTPYISFAINRHGTVLLDRENRTMIRHVPEPWMTGNRRIERSWVFA